MIEVRVRSMRLDEETPVALRDTSRVVDLVIDFSKSPDEIVAGLQAIFQEGIDSKRWTRRLPPDTGPDITT